MTPHKRYFSVALCIACLSVVSVANAGIVQLGGGWAADIVDPSTTSIVVDSVNPDSIVIEISKDFLDPPGIAGVFPANLIDFIQVDTDANTVASIIIEDESITNQTGVNWTDYHWEVLDSGHAWFNIPESNAWSVDPFTAKQFTGLLDANRAMGLDAGASDGSAGVVPDGSSFFPGGAVGNGHLQIDLDLSGGDPVSFTLKQFPTPEPATLGLLALGGLAVIRRRRA